MPKYLKIPMDHPYANEFIVIGLTQDGEEVVLCEYDSIKESTLKTAWLSPRAWAKRFNSEHEARGVIKITNTPNYNVPSDESIKIIEVEHQLVKNYDSLISTLVTSHIDVIDIVEEP